MNGVSPISAHSAPSPIHWLNWIWSYSGTKILKLVRLLCSLLLHSVIEKLENSDNVVPAKVSLILMKVSGFRSGYFFLNLFKFIYLFIYIIIKKYKKLVYTWYIKKKADLKTVYRTWYILLN